MELQEIKIDLIDKTVLEEAGLCMPLEFSDIRIQPDGLAQIKGIAYFIQCLEDLMGPCVIMIVADRDVF